MAAVLTIDGQQLTAKVNFKFEKLADKKYKDEKGEMGGLEKIYSDLMSYKSSALIAFWDCATAQYGKNQPSIEKIEEALEKVFESEEEDAVENLFKDAFQSVDNSGFFRLQLKEFWKNLDLVEEMSKEEEKDQARAAKKMYLNKRIELNPSITIPSLQTVQDS